jgi:hypothetical protein
VPTTTITKRPEELAGPTDAIVRKLYVEAVRQALSP